MFVPLFLNQWFCITAAADLSLIFLYTGQQQVEKVWHREREKLFYNQFWWKDFGSPPEGHFRALTWPAFRGLFCFRGPLFIQLQTALAPDTKPGMSPWFMGLSDTSLTPFTLLNLLCASFPPSPSPSPPPLWWWVFLLFEMGRNDVIIWSQSLQPRCRPHLFAQWTSLLCIMMNRTSLGWGKGRNVNQKKKIIRKSGTSLRDESMRLFPTWSKFQYSNLSFNQSVVSLPTELMHYYLTESDYSTSNVDQFICLFWPNIKSTTTTTSPAQRASFDCQIATTFQSCFSAITKYHKNQISALLCRSLAADPHLLPHLSGLL